MMSRITDVVQKFNILIVNQSIIDMYASFLAILTAVMDGTRMSSGSTWDQFVCRIWLTGMPLWASVAVSTVESVFNTGTKQPAHSVWLIILKRTFKVRKYDL